MQRPPLILPIAEARCCAPACNRVECCARRLVAHDRGRPVEDYSASQGWRPDGCRGFLLITAAMRQPAQPTQPARRVFKPIGVA